MTTTRPELSLLLALPLALIGCGSSSSPALFGPSPDGGTVTHTDAGSVPGADGGTVSHNDAGTVSHADGGTVSGSDAATAAAPDGGNSVAMIVDNGPAGAGGSSDVPFITVTLCVPGTNNCQAIDHVTVDTGSSGMRVISSVLSSSLTLPQVNASTGSPLAECCQFVDSFTWGSVRLADIRIGGEFAGSMPIQVIGDPSVSTVPTTCSSVGGSNNDTIATFGSNGLIGINQLIQDCGDYCTTATPPSGEYYSCVGATCTPVAVPVANQIANPIASFGRDSNGAVMTFGTVPDTGAATLAGTLTFGIGTQPNNGLGSASVLTVDNVGNLTTIFNSMTMATSYIDSGTNFLSFNDTSITQCTGNNAGYYCPASPLTLSGQIKGVNAVTSTVSFTVESADTLFSGSDTAFDDIAGTGSDNNTFAWGFPFFIGRSVFIGLSGATTPGGTGPFVAF